MKDNRLISYKYIISMNTDQSDVEAKMIYRLWDKRLRMEQADEFLNRVGLLT